MPSLSAVSRTRLSLVSQGFPVIHVCKEAEQQAQNVVTLLPFLTTHNLLFLLFYSSSPFISLSVFPFRSCLLTLFSSVSRPLLGDLQDVQKTLTHPIPPAGQSSLTGDFTSLMTGHSLPS